MMTNSDALILGILLGGLFIYFFLRYQKKRVGHKAQRRGKKGEEQAIVLLEQAGYRVLERQVERSTTFYVDGKPHTRILRGDLWLKKGGKHYLAEIKTGQKANEGLSDVRRQLLEYDLVFKPDGLLFVDMERKKIKVVAWDHRTKKVERLHRWMDFSLGLLCGAALVALIVFLHAHGGV